MARGYKVRINVKPDRRYEGKLRATISLSDEVVAMIDKPYVSVKRMQDRLALVQWDTKTGKGMSVTGTNTLQFGTQTDCEKMQDFCGEYTIVNKTDSGVLFVKLADRRPFTIAFDKVCGTKIDKVAEPVEEPVVVVQPASIKDVLQDAIERKKKEVEKAAEEVVAAENLLAEAKERLAKISDELSAYYVVLNAETGVTQ